MPPATCSPTGSDCAACWSSRRSRSAQCCSCAPGSSCEACIRCEAWTSACGTGTCSSWHSNPSLGHRTDVQSRQLVSEVLERAGSASGVEAATLTTEVPLTFIINNSRFKAAEKENDPSALRVATDIYTVGPGFFSTMGISILAGGTAEIESVLGSRAAELDKQRVGPRPVRPVIVNDAFARAAFPNESPIGRRIVGDGKALDIVGVVQTVKSRTIGEDPRPSIYLPILTEVHRFAGLPRCHAGREDQRRGGSLRRFASSSDTKRRPVARCLRSPNDGESRSRRSPRAAADVGAVGGRGRPSASRSRPSASTE